MATQNITQSHHALIKLLGKLSLIDAATAAETFSDSNGFPIAALAREGKLNEDDAINKVAERLGLSVTHIDKASLAKFVLMLEDTRLLKITIAKWRAMRAIPVSLDGQRLTVAFADPLSHEVKSSLEFELGLVVIPSIAAEDKIIQVLSKQFHTKDDFKLDDLLTPKDDDPHSHAAHQTGHAASESSVFGEDLDSAPVVRLVNKILADSVDRKASDIHIEPEKQGLAVRIRIDGIMHGLTAVPVHLQNPVISRLKLLAGMDISEKRKPQDGRFRIKTQFGVKDLRISSIPALHGENIVIRVLSSDLAKLEFSSLGIDAVLEAKIRRALAGSSRVMLVTGPTGSGKTSSLYTSLLTLCDGKRNIITIEDPIEYRMTGVTQIQVNPKIGLNFADGLRSILRQDPDVVMVGEIRDQETAQIAMQVAQTGHLVLSTFHTNSAAAAVTRLRDMGIPAYIIASSLGSVMAQRLVRRVCPHCAQNVSGAAKEEAAALGLEAEHIRVAAGCDECGQTGYIGRSGIYSFLDVNDDIREAIRNEKGEREIEQLARQNGFQTLEEVARAALNSGVTTIDEVVRVLGPLDPPVALMNSRQAVQNGFAKKKILLVEDDENTRAVLTMMFQNEFFDVIEAADGFQGLEAVFQGKPDLVVADLMMPRMSGLEMLKKIRSDSRTRELPVLMLTAAGTGENEIKLISDGADDFVAKGADSRVLMARIERLLSRSAIH